MAPVLTFVFNKPPPVILKKTPGVKLGLVATILVAPLLLPMVLAPPSAMPWSPILSDTVPTEGVVAEVIKRMALPMSQLPFTFIVVAPGNVA